MAKFMLVVAGLCVVVAYGLVSVSTASAEHDHYECSIDTMASEEFRACVKDFENAVKNRPKVEDEITLGHHGSDLCSQYASDSLNTRIGCSKAISMAIGRCHQHLPDFDRAFACVEKEIRGRYE